MFDVAILTPSAGIVRMDYAESLARLVLFFCTHPVIQEEKEQGISIKAQQSFSTSCNREMLIDSIINTPFTHVLFIDDDMGFEEDALHIMAQKDQPIVLANYPKKVLPVRFISRGFKDEEIVTRKDSEGLEEVYIGGFGFALIKREVFMSVPKPRFPLLYNKEHNIYSSEDYWFCAKAREMGYKIYIDHDASKKVWHVGNYRFQGGQE